MNFSRFYLNIIIKKPYIFIFTILVSVFVLAFMLINIKLDIIKTYEVKLEVSDDVTFIQISKNDKVMEDVFNDFQNNKVLVYINRNNLIVQSNIKEIQINGNFYLLILNSSEQLYDFIGIENLKMDIFTGKESLLSRIFLRGGKDYAK